MAMNSSSELDVRPCCKADAGKVNAIMRKAWPGEPKWRNRDYWANVFANPSSSKRYGYVIEKIDHDIKGNNFVIGFAIYECIKPSRKRTVSVSSWHINDFNCKHYKWCNGVNDADINILSRYSDLIKSDINLHHLPKLSSFLIHFTDVAIDPDHRGKGYDTLLMRMIIYAFPKGTRFGLEVKETNVAAIKCYKKCDFVIKRKIKHYYGTNKAAYKMVLISQCGKEQEFDRDIDNMSLTQFIAFRQKTDENTTVLLENALCRKLGLNRRILSGRGCEDIFMIESLCCLEKYDEISKMIMTNKYLYNKGNICGLLIILLSMKDKNHLLNMQCTRKILSYLLQICDPNENIILFIMLVFYSTNIAQCFAAHRGRGLFIDGLYEYHQKAIKEHGQKFLTQMVFEEVLKLSTGSQDTHALLVYGINLVTRFDTWLYGINETIVLHTKQYGQIIENYTVCFQHSTVTYVRVLCLRGLAVFCYKRRLYLIGSKVWKSAYVLSNGYMYPSFVKEIYPKMKRKFAKKRRKSKCDNCGKSKTKLKACCDCMRAVYCSRRCQKIAWKLHRDLCDKVWRDPLTRIKCMFA